MLPVAVFLATIFTIQVLAELVESCRTHGFTDLVVVHEHRGQPDGLVVSHMPYGPTAYFGLSNAVLRHDLGDKKEVRLINDLAWPITSLSLHRPGQVGTVSEAYPHLIFDSFSSPLGIRVATILKHLFPVPKPDTRRVLTFANRADYIAFRHHVYEKPRGATSIQLTEVGPRFDLKLYQIRLGTLDQAHAEVEWVVRSFTRSAKKTKLALDDA